MPRIKIRDRTSIYHCMSRTTGGEHLFGDEEKEVLRKMIWQVADFSGVEVLTYAVMKNHFHVLVRIPQNEEVSDCELVRRFGVLYPKPGKHQVLSLGAVAKVLAEGGEEADALRRQLLARMGDVSAFMKTLKQRFSIWYNKTHGRFGTLWAERFKSVLVEGQGNPLQTMAAYIDLNPVRAGLVADPKDYRFCGYGEAVAGRLKARQGLTRVWLDWIGKSGDDSPDTLAQTEAANRQEDALRSHRSLIFAKGEHEQAIPREQAVRVLEKQGAILPKATVLRCRVRYFTDGAVLGSKDFVRNLCDTWQSERGRHYPPRAHELGGADWGDLATIRGLRRKIFS